MMSFVNAWMLAGLVAVGLPVLVHLLTRPRPRVIALPTFHLLMEAGRGQQALHRLRTWVILAMRTVAILALVLLFTRPFWSDSAGGAGAAEAGQGRPIALVVDASASMGAAEAGVPLMATASAQAADVLRALPPGSEAAVIFIAAQPRSVLPAASRNLAALHEGLADARATYQAGDPAAALALARRMLGEGGEIFVFSDFQRTDWEHVDFASDTPHRYTLRPVVEQHVENVGLTGVAVSPADPVEGETVELRATLFNASPVGRQETVTLDLPGVSRSQDVELQPYASAEAAFSFSLPGAGVYEGEVAIEADALTADDTRYVKLRVREALSVLLISDSERSSTRSGAFFVSTALAPEPSAGRGLQVTRRVSADVDRGILETADVFVVVPPAQLSGETVEVLTRRVSEGAALVCFLDGPTSPPTVHALAGASEGQLRPPFELHAMLHADEPRGRPLRRPSRSGGALSVFEGPDQGDLASLRVSRHFFTEDHADRPDEVLLRHADGSAAVALTRVGSGAAVFANVPVTADGGTLVGSGLFPAMLHELLRALRRGDAAAGHVPGRPWQMDVSVPGDADDAAEFRLVGPGEQTWEPAVVSRGRTTRLSVPAVDQPGLYRIALGEREADVAAVNVHGRVSDTRLLNIRHVQEDAAAAGAAVNIVDQDGQMLAAGEARPLWPLLAALAAVMLAGEMLLLAWWRGGGRSGRR